MLINCYSHNIISLFDSFFYVYTNFRFLIYKPLIRPKHLKSYLECVHVAMAL